jgi:hypothetical protein
LGTIKGHSFNFLNNMKKTIILFIVIFHFLVSDSNSQGLSEINSPNSKPTIKLNDEIVDKSNSSESDTDKKNELFVKFDIFYPIIDLFGDDNEEYTYGMAFEYKFKNRISANLSGYLFQFDDGSIYKKGFAIIPEGRYYIKGHFVGAFLKYEQRNIVDGPIYLVSTSRMLEYEFLWTLGGLYGYQLELGRFNLEGRLGIGVAHNYYHHVESRGYDKNNSEGSFFPEMVLAINIGYRIF